MSSVERATLIHVSGALFSAEGKLLLLRRHEVPDGESLWVFPGGIADFGEPPEVALMRCFSEGTDIEVVPDRPIGTWSEIRRIGSREEYIVHIDMVVKTSGAIMGVDLDKERYEGFAWCQQKDAAAHLGTPALKSLGDKAFALLSRTRKNT